jgi:hypothetical protein
MRHVIRNVIGDLVLAMCHVMHHVMRDVIEHVRDVIEHVTQSWGPTFACLKCTRTGRSYHELDRLENCVKLENILSMLPEPEVTRRGLYYWD